MAEGKALDSADALNIDGYFKQQLGNSTVAGESDEDDPDTSQDAPDKKPDKKGKKRLDKDSDEDIDLENDEDSEEGDDEENSEDNEDLDDDDLLDEDEDLSSEKEKKPKKDVSKDLDALTKKSQNAELQRQQMQSERDAAIAQSKKANEQIDSLTDRVEKLTKLTEKLTRKAEQSDSLDFLTGDPDALVTEEQFKKAFEKIVNPSKKSDSSSDNVEDMIEEKIRKMMGNQSNKSDSSDQPKIGSDAEAQKFWDDVQNIQKAWTEKQSDYEEVGSFYGEHRTALDPELATIPSIDGRYNQIRFKRIESELKNELASYKKALRKAKQKIKRMGKGELPETASGKRGKPQINDKQPGDALTNFFEK